MSDWCAVPIDGLVRPSLRRRRWLAAIVATGLAPWAARAEEPPEAGFEARSFDAAMQALGGLPAQADAVRLSIADVIEDGAYAAVKVVSGLPGTSEIALIAEMNPNPLIARFTIPSGTEPELAVRIKLAQTGPVWAVVRAQGRLYCASKRTTVTTGACAG